MKKLLIAVTALFTLATAANANTNIELNNSTNPMESLVNDENQEKVPVKLEELPEAIKKVLASDSYKGWTPSTAFLVKGEKSFYEINLTNAEGEAATVKLDEAGAPVEK